MWRFLKNLKTAETLSRLHLSSKSLPGVLEDMEVLMNLEVVSFDRDHNSEASVKVSSRSKSETMSRVHLSSKSLPGVLEDVEIPDEPGGGAI